MALIKLAKRIRVLQNSAAQTAAQNAAQNTVHEAAQAAITLRLEEQLAQIQHYQKRINKLETIERNRIWEESRQQLELAEKLR